MGWRGVGGGDGEGDYIVIEVSNSMKWCSRFYREEPALCQGGCRTCGQSHVSICCSG